MKYLTAKLGSASCRLCWPLAIAVVLAAPPTWAQIKAPDYEECRLDSIFPAGGQRGQAVAVELRGFRGGLASPRSIVIDGPPGISISEIKSVSNDVVQATFQIAPDAPPGRRWVRVASERSGLTNFAHFVVSTLPEQLEQEPNNEPATAQIVTAPLVVNGRVNPKADRDCFRFQAKRGQRIVAAVSAHALDVHGQGSNYGIADMSLELRDDQGRVLAEAEDTVGFDPLIESVIPADGDYIACVKLVAYGGFAEAVYRLTLGEVPFVTSVFPPGVQRGSSAVVDLTGPNVPAGTRFEVSASPDDWFPVEHIAWNDVSTGGNDVPIVRGDFPEIIEAEPNNDASQATALMLPATANARIDTSDDADWYRVRLAANQAVWFEVVAHRFLRSPVDTLLQVFDTTGKPLAENDDDNTTDPGYESFHDFRTTDSKLLFRAPADGEYLVRVTDRTGASGARAVYRLTVFPATPDFHVRHFPDAVPIWGPGSTAALAVRVDRIADMKDDIELSVEGLPAGWTGSRNLSLGTTPQRPYATYQAKLFLTITAPADATPGTTVPFRVVGRAKVGDQIIERISYPLTLFYTSDTGFFRVTPVTRAAVATPQGPWLEAKTNELSIKAGENATIPVRVHESGSDKELSLVVNIATIGVACSHGTPVTVPIRDGVAEVPLTMTGQLPPGTLGLVVARAWRSDVRIGMPGPCTTIIRLNVQSP
jgi:hypothetical protein